MENHENFMHDYIGPSESWIVMWVAIWLYVGSLYLNKQFRQVNSDTGNVGASNRVSTRIIRSDCSSFRPTVSVTSKGRASVHVYNGVIRAMISLDRPSTDRISD